MKVYKFGGASIKNANAIRNMVDIIKRENPKELLIVVSAMDKTTNLLESILQQARASHKYVIDELKNNHLRTVEDLFSAQDTAPDLNPIFNKLEESLRADLPYNEHYDCVVSIGELLSSKIIFEYMQAEGLPVTLVNSAEYIVTDDTFRNGKILWDVTRQKSTQLKPLLENGLVLTQGFIGGTENGKITTLGREGSDYTGAIYAYCLDAESFTVWKDVPGILNADPKLIADAKLFSALNYKEAAEMTYYGASVIHPKTIKPLANRNIPLYVKSFDQPEADGTIIHGKETKHIEPCIIIKFNQCLVSFYVKDYTFINEDNLSTIFGAIAKCDIKIHTMQNSAISFSILIDYDVDKLQKMMDELKPLFEIKYNTNVGLITLKNYTPQLINKYCEGKEILLQQQSRNNYRAVFMIPEAPA